MLAERMREHGGFDHNRQSLRVVELLEAAYPNYPGLNLTFEVREGLQKHLAFYDLPEKVEQAFRLGHGQHRQLESRAALEKYHCPSLKARIAS